MLLAPAMLVKVTPLSALTCHCTVAIRAALTAAMKETVLPTGTLWLVGLVVTVKARTVRVAAVEVTV